MRSHLMRSHLTNRLRLSWGPTSRSSSMITKLWTTWRRPLPPRGPVATVVTIASGVIPLAAILVIADGALRARLALSGIGAMLIAVGLARPRFAWKYDEGWRSVLGDRGYVALFVGLGAALVIGAWRAIL